MKADDEWSDLVRKAIFCQGEENPTQVLALWQRAAKIKPLDHLGRFNQLLCRRAVAPKENHFAESIALVQEAGKTRYYDQCLVIALICSCEASQFEITTQIAVCMSQRIRDALQKVQPLDLVGETWLIDERGAAIEERSGARIIQCLEILSLALPHSVETEAQLDALIALYREREAAMKTLPELPPREVKKGWWRFWSFFRNN